MTDDMPSLEAAFLDLAEHHEAPFRRIAHAYARGAEAEDLLQEIWLQIWRSLPGFDARAQLETWAFRIALNTAISYRRRLRPDAEQFDEHGGYHPAPPTGRAGDILADFLPHLRPADRAVLLLHLDGCEKAQIADILGLSANAVAIRLTRIRKQYESRYI